MVELARKETEDGIALPYRAMLYTEMREDGTIQNLYNAEVNAKNNRANVRQLFGNANESIANVQQAMVAHDQVQSFFNSFKIDPGADAVRTEFQELMLDYVLELGNRMPVMSLGDAIDKMAEHIVQENYEFIQPNPDTAPTRLKKSQMGIHSAGEIEQALIQYTDRLLAERESPIADLAATDDLYAWKVRGDESGLELVFLNENRGAQFSSRQKILSFSELMVVTEDYKNARGSQISSSDAMVAEDPAVTDTMLKSFGVGQEMVGIGIGRPKGQPVKDVEEASTSEEVPTGFTDRRSRQQRSVDKSTSMSEEVPTTPTDRRSRQQRKKC